MSLTEIFLIYFPVVLLVELYVFILSELSKDKVSQDRFVACVEFHDICNQNKLVNGVN